MTSRRWMRALGVALRSSHFNIASSFSQPNITQYYRANDEVSCLIRLCRAFSSLPSHTILSMPSLSPTMTQGNLIKWHVKAGDEITAGTMLADIETDKATLGFENQEEGFIAKILLPENTSNIAVGTPVAVIVEDRSSISAFATYSAGITKAPTPSSSVSTSSANTVGHATSPASYPSHTKLSMPSLSPTMERGNIVKWMVEEGTEIKPGDVLAEIETDKATLAFENQDDGFIAKIVKPAGSKDVPVGTTVAIIVEDKTSVAAFASYSETSSPAASSNAAPKEATVVPSASASAASSPAAPKTVSSSRLGPAARMLLAESGLSRDQVTPTGPKGIITRYDVAAAIAAGVKPTTAVDPAPLATPHMSAPPAAAAAAAAVPQATGPVPGSTYVDTPNTQIRKIIATRLLESKVAIPSLYLVMDTRLDEANQLRAMLLQQGIKVSLNDIVLKAIATALAEVPEANCFWDSKAQEAKQFNTVDVCVAVATEKGLITPIVKGADKKSLQQISKDVRDLALRARDNKLKPEEFMGGSFTVSNLGMMGVSHFSAIINPPQAAILAVGTSQQKAVILPSGSAGSETFMTVTLSADHRAYDGDMASKLLNAFKALIEAPSRLLM
ncbi:hypothetical protein CEUSTIGMA_g6640.t1 [Chlamydomonas eustigma]|uniref:Dihydrolipoamide acetyltransferase component of pyruvate dehydrogenase complex n=1 Tax=Chlamydomonas eustigma TaxID=1157962 RepID=A0A250X8V0_9CHLO|nr:hypothetical protein CEUSTIGMA_g6640.t1 [Chlamydomonas eustigma]|eukprot:GAX79200.1 hypothetical protein CEUSTIGMA_g6640.t1 [Chlamydomonas eustigma]